MTRTIFQISDNPDLAAARKYGVSCGKIILCSTLLLVTSNVFAISKSFGSSALVPSRIITMTSGILFMATAMTAASSVSPRAIYKTTLVIRAGILSPMIKEGLRSRSSEMNSPIRIPRSEPKNIAMMKLHQILLKVTYRWKKTSPSRIISNSVLPVSHGPGNTCGVSQVDNPHQHISMKITGKIDHRIFSSAFNYSILLAGFPVS